MKVYVAGPWVFRPDAKEHAEYLRETLRNAGYTALLPLDNDIAHPNKYIASYMIATANRDMIDKCDYVIADITPFRGPSADVGTAYEIGYADAKRKPVFLWSLDVSDYKSRVVPDGMHIEDFGRCDNLMFTAGECVSKSFEAAVGALKELDHYDA